MATRKSHYLSTLETTVLKWFHPKGCYHFITLEGFPTEDAVFPLGDLAITARAKITVTVEEVRTALRRHTRGDWGKNTDEDTYQNDDALKNNHRLFSAYETAAGLSFRVLTDADRSQTVIFLPEEDFSPFPSVRVE